MKDRNEDIHDELQALSPLLAQWKKEKRPEGFDTPPRYFRELPGEVLARLRAEEMPRTARRLLPAWLAGLWRRPRYAFALVSVTLLIAAGLYWLGPKGPDATTAGADPFAQLSEEEIGRYVEANLRDFDEKWVIEAAATNPDVSVLPTPDEEGLDQYLDELIRDLDDDAFQDIL